MPEEELENEENDIDEAMLEELTDEDAELEEEGDVADVPTPADEKGGEEEEEKDDLDDDDLFEEDAEDVDFDSFDDEDHL